jgi:opacity protein-like surface antigen
MRSYSHQKTTMLVLLFLGTTSASAAGLEVAPFYGVRFGGQLRDASGDSINLNSAPAVGATINIPLRGMKEKLELLYSHQETDFSVGAFPAIDVTVDEWQAGLLREYDYDGTQPFLVGTLGATSFSFSNNINSSTLFSLGLGGGVKYLATDNIGFRLDLRATVSIVEGSGSAACSGGCVVHFQGSTFIQGEIIPSVLIKF